MTLLYSIFFHHNTYKVRNKIDTFYREVSITDVTNIEKRLMQTMDMIVMKKKKIAISQRQAMESNEYGRRKHGLWGMLYSVGSDRNHES